MQVEDPRARAPGSAEPSARHVLSLDGTPLVMRCRQGAPDAPTAFLGHSQPTYQDNLTDLAAALSAMGLTVWTGDLRGHGHSSSSARPLGYLHRETGWDDLIADATVMVQTALGHIPWGDRLLVMPNINALLTLEMLKGDPGLARSIVLISPPPNQIALSLMARAFIKGRMLVQDADAPDELTLHHLYAFLGAHLDDRQHLLDVTTSDRAIIEEMIADPLAFPTPTAGYWMSIFRGFAQAWSWPRHARIRPGTRILVLYGADDPMTARGRFVRPMSAWFAERGVEDVSAYRIEGGRSALFLDERRLSISRVIMDWHAGSPAPARTARAPGVEGFDAVSSEVLDRLGFDDPASELEPDALVELCYNAIEDESRWVEMLYRVARDIARRKDMDETELDGIFASLMPHWERSYRVKRQIMTNAALGVVLQNVIERLDIGMALLTGEYRPLHSNRAFGEALYRCGLVFSPEPDPRAIAEATRILLAPDIRARIETGPGEAMIVHNEQPIGAYLRPSSLRQTGLQRGGPSGVLILRHGRKAFAEDQRLPLLQLAYGLTAQEALVALRVCEGGSPDAIATELGISINTMRTHLKRVYAKCGVAGQAALASRMLSGPVGWLGTAEAGPAPRAPSTDAQPGDRPC
ncbi:serine aminopeptidase domain-containing protein [Pelagibacterium montanilacus]|uniref:serine aminopeptidase domain-containing protein n=1 Tax=Pelagibacterium montanilacus TaxID=2185280 RepID=UPI000F8C83F7|nr:alpha/beta hydrolase [Pelagibacterium montanilacus]